MMVAKGEISFEVLACVECGVLFGLTVEHARMLRKSGKGFRCLNGHTQYFTPPAELTPTRDELLKEVQTLKADLASAKHRAEQAEARAMQMLAAADQQNVTGKEPVIDPNPAPSRAGETRRVACKHCGKKYAAFGACTERHLKLSHNITGDDATDFMRHFTAAPARPATETKQ